LAACEEAFNEERALDQYRRDQAAVSTRRGSVTYDFTIVNHNGDDDVSIRYEVTVYTAGDESTGRVDLRLISTSFGDTDSEMFTAIRRESGDIVCSTDASRVLDDASPLEIRGACVPFASARSEVAGLGLFVAPFFRLSAADDSPPVLAGMRTGTQLRRRTHCYRFDTSGEASADPASRVEACYSEDGIQTRYRSDRRSQSFRLIATDAGDVADADFDPPYPIIDSD
jgi:hypothetical protein